MRRPRLRRAPSRPAALASHAQGADTHAQGAASELLLDHDEDGYCGPADLLVADELVRVTVQLAGYFQPLDGRYTWYGRVDANAELAHRARPGTPVVLWTPFGRADASLTDPDLWGRFRIGATSTPPFPLATSIAEADAAAAH